MLLLRNVSTVRMFLLCECFYCDCARGKGVSIDEMLNAARPDVDNTGSIRSM